jgi:hypothetical protein
MFYFDRHYYRLLFEYYDCYEQLKNMRINLFHVSLLLKNLVLFWIFLELFRYYNDFYTILSLSVDIIT